MANKPEKRGPKLGDAASLWNFTPAPGWTNEEAQILRLCLMKFGVGRWMQILDTGLLPGKMIQQLNGQTQRLIGQQSLSAYTGLQVDIDRIRADNSAKKDVERKSGLIIWSGPNPTKQMKEQWQQEAKGRYGLTDAQKAEVEAALEEAASNVEHVGGKGNMSARARMPLFSLMDSDVTVLSREQKLALLHRLRRKLQLLVERLASQPGCAEQPAAAPTGQAMDVDEPARRPASNGAVLQEKEDANSALPQKKGKANASKPGSKRASAGGTKQKKPQPKKAKTGSDSEQEAAGGTNKGKGPGKGRKGGGSSKQTAQQVAHEADMNQLMGMGFNKKQAADALEECDGDVEASIMWLCSNCV